MESERKVKIITLVAVIVAVIGLTIAFAAMSRTLNIHGSGTMDPVNWDIYFENIKLKSDTSPSSVTGNPTPTSGNTAATINNLNVTLKNPGDEVVWTADITNNGDVNAEIQSFSLTPNLTNELLEFTAVYTDVYEHGHVITVGDMLYAGETRNITITFKYKDITDESLLPDEAEEINVSYQIVYVQSNRVSTTTTTTTAAPVVNNCTSFETKSTYSVGDVIALCNTSTGKSEDFYVISDNGETVTALAKYNLLVGDVVQYDSNGQNIESRTTLTNSDSGYGIQSSSAILDIANMRITGAMAFSETYYWTYTSGSPFIFNSSSYLWTPVVNYQSYLTTTLGKTSATATLMSYEQAESLKTTNGGSLPTWSYENSQYWLGSANGYNGVWYVTFIGDIGDTSFSYDYIIGVRPVITIAKSDL